MLCGICCQSHKNVMMNVYIYVNVTINSAISPSVNPNRHRIWKKRQFCTFLNVSFLLSPCLYFYLSSYYSQITILSGDTILEYRIFHAKNILKSR